MARKATPEELFATLMKLREDAICRSAAELVLVYGNAAIRCGMEIVSRREKEGRGTQAC